MKVFWKIYTGIFCLGLFAIFGHAAERQTLRGHVPAAVSRLQPIGTLSASTNLQLAIGFPLRNKAALTNLLARIYNPSDPLYHHYLTPEQFAREFGPSENDYQTVAAFAKSNGFSITATYPNRMLLDVSGSVGNVERTFHLAMHVYRHPTERRTFFAPDAEPSLDLPVPLLRISGLSDYSLPQPRLKFVPLAQTKNASPKSGSGPQGTYMGNDFRAAYVPGTPLTGAGQTVGLLQFDGYTPGDITYYESVAGLSGVTLSNVLIDGFNGQPSGNGGEVEVTLDIEMAMSMAPGLSQIILYEAPNPSPFEDVLNRMATDNAAKQLSCSWFTPGGGPDPVADQIFQQMAAQGQSFLNASGDFDAWTGPIDFPGESPYITQVGGTTLTTAGAGGPWFSETVWNWGGLGSGGGISTDYPIPSWQTNVSMAMSQGSTTMRNTPDVALTADNVYVRADGQDLGVGGTSCAAPLWAGFAALVNQQAAAYGTTPPGFLNPLVYQIGLGGGYLAAFHDITTGDNTSSSSPDLFFAVPGYDLCTGWGTPAGQGLIDALAPPPIATPPSILIEPQDQTVPTASNAVFVVTATGSPVLNYQWSFNGTNIQDATNALLQLVNVQPSQSGNYSVQVTNQFGTVTSSNAVLTVQPPIPPVIVMQPQDQTVPLGGIAFFSVVVTGTPPGYQWTLDGNPIPGATNNPLMVFNVQSTNAGMYAVQVTNGAGATVSSNALLSVLPPGTSCESNTNGLVGWWAAEGNAYNAASGLYGQLDGGINFVSGEIGQAFNFNGIDADVQNQPSASLNIGAGSAFTLEAWINPSEVAHNHPLIEWGHPLLPVNGLMLWISIPSLYGGAGPGSLILDLQDIGFGEVSTPAGLIQSNVWQHVAATYDSTSGTAALYIDGSLITQTNLGSMGTFTPEYLWFGYDPVSKLWGPSIFGEEARYRGQMDEILIYNRALSAAEIQATFNAGSYGLCPLPTAVVNIQPTNQTVLVGNTATFTAVADGTLPLSFQWYLNGTNIPGATDAKLTLTNVQQVQAGNYTVQASNGFGSVLSSNAVLVVNTNMPPVITAQPTNQSTAVGNSVTLKLTVTGSPPLYYQWTFGGTNLAGATNASLKLNSVSFTNGGFYSVGITNVAGSTVSSNAILTVYPGWIQAGASTSSWSCVASSADGSKLVAGIYGGSIYRSTDSGATWLPTGAPSGSWWSIASSADGNNLAAAPNFGSIYVSTNAGADWTKTTSPSTAWRAVACSSDGTRLVAGVYNGFIYLSTNSGLTWVQSSAPSAYWYGIASSTDGSKLAGVVDNSGPVYVSTNSGSAWTRATNAPVSSWLAVASSGDGSGLIASAGSRIYLSANSGQTWMQASNLPVTTWQAVASSMDGYGLVVVTPNPVQGGQQIYVSSDAGATWRPAGAPASSWVTVASSANGNKLVAAGGGYIGAGQIYTWQSAPTLTSSTSRNGLTLSWPLMWTGYALQENSDLTTTDWTTVTVPAIETNGQNQVIITPTNGQNFYRLTYPYTFLPTNPPVLQSTNPAFR